MQEILHGKRRPFKSFGQTVSSQCTFSLREVEEIKSYYNGREKYFQLLFLGFVVTAFLLGLSF